MLRTTLLLLLLSVTAFAGSLGTEGGNISAADANTTQPSSLWGAIVGTLNGTNITDYTHFISVQSVPTPTVFTNNPNGTYSTLMNGTLILTRLPYKPATADLSTPAVSDFQPGGIFENFTVFSGLNYSSTPENPYDTFAPFPLAICRLGNVSIACPYITTNPNKRMGILKFDNGTHTEPVFVELINNGMGFNGSFFDFQFIVPKLETYYFYTYGNATAPPYVHIITPKPIVYTDGNLQLTYNMTDSTGISACWYFLDNVRHNMAACGPAVSLSLGQGTHNLTLFANNTLGLTSSDNVIFYVRIRVPAPPGGGGTLTPYVPPVVPPVNPPPEVTFTLTPDIWVIIDYPKEGVSEFRISSNAAITSLDCHFSGDFANYTRVELVSDSTVADTPTKARIYVSMTPQEILDYSGSLLGSMQCTGMYNATVLGTNTATVHLAINKPELTMGNKTFEIFAGEEKNASSMILNNGTGNATAMNISIQVLDYPLLVKIISVPDTIGRGQEGQISFVISAPSGMAEGTYIAPIIFYDNGKAIGTGTIILNVLHKAGPKPPPGAVCSWPDLAWTLIILLIGFALSILAYRLVYGDIRKKENEENERGPKTYGKE